MCGIAGCAGHENAPEFVLNSLEALESRGYDSMGIAYPSKGRLEVIKTLGGVSGIKDSLPEVAMAATTAIGHTRWRTHGGKTLQNSHPHSNHDQTISVVHNGTVENFWDLKAELKDQGYTFSSETDTETIPHLIDFYYKENRDPEEAFTKAMQRIRGAYAVLACFSDHPNMLFGAKLGSPLVLGVNGHEHFAASVPNVLTDQTKKAIFLEEEEIAILSTDGYEIKHKEGLRTTRAPQELDEIYERAVLGEFPHFMLKEIYDAPEAIRSTIRGRVRPDENTVKLGGLEDYREQIRQTERLIIIGCGTSYHAGLVGEKLIEQVAKIPVEVQLASEFRYNDEPFDERTAVIAISQSGETADTKEAVKKAKENGMLALGINNAPGSQIDRMTDAGVHCNAGEEVSVASTKAFISQVTVLAEIALALSKQKSTLQKPMMHELTTLPGKIEAILEDTSAIKEMAEKYADSQNFLFIGRGYEYPSAIEAALKLKEISYINAVGLAAGEMKHGSIALIDKEFPTMAIATDGPLYDKMISNIEQVKGRGGPVIALANEGNGSIGDLVDDVLYVPKTLESLQPILNGVVLQLFAYYVASKKGLDVDRPRNLAKSVTVE